MLVIQQLIGCGKERACYLHPHDPTKAVKVLLGSVHKQMDRELKFYAQLSKRRFDNYAHLPRYYGKIETNLGTGYVVDLVRDYDGSISKRLSQCFFEGMNIADYQAELDQLFHYLLQHRIIFNHDMYEGNILVRRVSANESRLVIIDGLGEVAFFHFPNRIPVIARWKVARRWARFYARMQSNHAAIQNGEFL